MTTTQPATPALTPEEAQKQTRILRDGTAQEAIFFGRYVYGADIAALQARVLAVGTGHDALQFALCIKKADIPACQARVLADGTVFDITSFAKHVRNADVPALQDHVLTKGNAWGIYVFAEGVAEADVDICEARFLEVCKENEQEYCFYFARDVVGANTNALQDHILKFGESNVLFAFARGIQFVEVDLLYDRAKSLDFKGLEGKKITEFGELVVQYQARAQKRMRADAPGGLVGRGWHWIAEKVGAHKPHPRLLPIRGEAEAVIARYRAIRRDAAAERRQQQAGQAEVGVADDAGAAPDAPAG